MKHNPWHAILKLPAYKSTWLVVCSAHKHLQNMRSEKPKEGKWHYSVPDKLINTYSTSHKNSGKLDIAIFI